MQTVVDSFKGKYSYGMRALGTVAGTYHTNTYEGFKRWQRAGINFWETDVAITDDGEYVMIGHFLDKETMNRMEIQDTPELLTKDWYLNQKLFPKSTKGLTPLSLEQIIHLAFKYSDTVWMLDMYPFSLENSYSRTMHFLNYLDNTINAIQKKNDSTENLYERIIVESYNKEMFRAVHEFGKAKYIQMSIGKFIENEHISDINEIVKYAYENDVNVISYEWRYAKKNIEHLKVLRNCDFLFVSRSVTNLFDTKKKKKYGVNIALLDIWIRRPQDFFELGRLFISRLQKKHG